jgi:WbqC-like protein family
LLVAIHQPNFLPWLGWFDKLARADVFILLDTVPHQHGGSNYTNRVQILAQGEPCWITVPVTRGSDARHRIDRLRIADNGVWRRKLRATFAQSYAKAPFFDEAMTIADTVLDADTDLLCEFNLVALRLMAAALGLREPRLLRASTIVAEGTGTDRLVALVRAVGGDAYLTGHGASGYQEDERFAAAGIRVEYQRYAPPPYRQLRSGAFVPGLSAIDALMNCGSEAASLIGHRACARTDG